MASDRRLTVQAIAAYLAQLTPGSGNLVLRVPKNQLPALMATAEQALGLARQEARKRMLACSERKGAAALLIAPKPLAPRDLRRLRRYCRRKRLSVEYPMLEIRESDTELESKTKKQDEQLALLNAAVAVDDSKPFLEDPPAFSALAAAGLKELRGLRHVPEAKQRKRLAPKRQGAAPADKPASPSPTARRAAVAAMAVLIALGLALLALLLPPSKAPEAHNPTFTFRGATLLFGVAASLGMFAASELMLQLLGDRAYGWQLVLPLGLVGLAGGRLWVDSVPKGRIRSYLIVTVALGVPALIGAHVALPALVASALTSSAGGALALLAVGAAGLLMGWLLGAPLAAAMRLSGRQNPVAVASIWGLHLAGWALGGALAALSVYYLGSAKLLTLAAAALGVGGLLLAASGPPSAPKKVPATLGPTPS